MSNSVTIQGKTIDQIDGIDTAITDSSKKAYFVSQGVIPVNGPEGGESGATGKQTLGVPVSEIATDVSGKADKSEMAIAEVSGDATKKNIQLKSGTATDVVVAHQDISGKTDKAIPAAAGNLAKLNATGNLEDSGIVSSQVVTTADVGSDGQVLTYTTQYGVKWKNPGTPVPSTSDATNGDVLTYDTTDGIVWKAPAGGGGASIPPVPSDYGNSYYALGINRSTGELTWVEFSDGSGGTIKYI